MARRTACSLVIGLILTSSLSFMLGSSTHDRGPTVKDAIAMLENGVLGPGSTFTDDKWWISVGRESDDGRLMGMCIQWSGSRCVAMYSCDGKLYAACALQRIVGENERWYFFDEDLFALHVKTALSARGEDAEGDAHASPDKETAQSQGK